MFLWWFLNEPSSTCSAKLGSQWALGIHLPMLPSNGQTPPQLPFYVSSRIKTSFSGLFTELCRPSHFLRPKAWNFTETESDSVNSRFSSRMLKYVVSFLTQPNSIPTIMPTPGAIYLSSIAFYNHCATRIPLTRESFSPMRNRASPSSCKHPASGCCDTHLPCSLHHCHQS